MRTTTKHNPSETAKRLSRYAAHAGETETWIDVAAPTCTEAEKLHAIYSAAPELLAALKPLVHLYAGQITNTGEYYPQLLDAARAAIAKAKGY